MRFCTSLLAAMLLLFGGGAPAHSQVIFSDDFDGGGTAPNYTDQAHFESVWVPIGCAFGCGDPPVNEENSMQLSQDWIPIEPARGRTLLVDDVATNSEAWRNQVTFSATPEFTNSNDKVAFSFDFYDSNPTVSPYRHHINLLSTGFAGGTNQLIGLGLNNNQNASANGGNYFMARILGYNPADHGESGGASGSYFKLNDGGPDTLRGEDAAWRNLKVEISMNPNGIHQDYHFYVDDTLAKVIEGVGAITAPGVNVVRQYSSIQASSGLTAAGNFIYLDNFHVEFIAGDPSDLPGDLNGDGIVDAGDYVYWRKNNLPQADYDEWRAHFGDVGGAGSSSSLSSVVPEPSAAMLLLIGIAGLATRRRTR